MKVLFGLYPSCRFSPGGKEKMLGDTCRELSNLGVEVHQLDPWDWGPPPSYDIFHVFGSEYYQHEMIVRLQATGCRIVVTPILVYADGRMERRARWWRHLDPLVPVSTTFSLRKDVLRRADVVLPNSSTEAAQLRDVYGVRPEAIKQVPLAVSPLFADARPDLFIQQTGVRDPVLSVCRIEPRKNTLRLIEAMKPLGLPLVLIGAFDEVHADYCARVREEIAAHHWITHLGRVDDPELIASAYAAARVHVLVSEAESGPGLVSLEAGLAGANLVTTPEPYIVEYFSDAAWYARPTDIPDITRQIRAAYSAPRSAALRQRIQDRYTTTVVTRAMLDIYRDLRPAL